MRDNNHKVRILLADDHHVVRAGLRALIDTHADMVVVAEADDAEDACRLAAELAPDVAILGVSMPRLGGAQAAGRIRHQRPEVKVLALAVHEDRGYLQQLLKAGASGYLLKRAAADDLIQAIRVVARGGLYLDSGPASQILGSLTGRDPQPRPDPSADASLSGREEDVLRLVARGYTCREIADQLKVCIKTVELSKARAMEKIGATSRAEIVSYAIQEGWLSQD